MNGSMLCHWVRSYTLLCTAVSRQCGGIHPILCKGTLKSLRSIVLTVDRGMFMLHIFTGLFNTFTFWHLGNSQIDMQSRLFSVFMTLTIAPPLIQQLQPRYLNMRSIYESREGNSKIYSWVAFVCGAILSEIPYRIVAGTLYCMCHFFKFWALR